MAKRPNIDTGQMEKADKLMSDIVSKFDTLARFDELPIFSLLPRQLDDIDKKLAGLNRASQLFSKGGKKAWGEYTRALKDNKKQQDQLKKELTHINGMIAQQAGRTLPHQRQRLAEINQEMQQLIKFENEHLKVGKALAKMAGQEGARFLDWFGGSVASMGFSTVFAGLKLLATGVEKVYDLQEKWTHAIGTFRRQIGPATEGTAAFEKVAADLNMPLQELGYGFDEAHQRTAQFVQGFGFANEQAKEWVKNAIKLSVVTGAGADSIGELSRTLVLMGTQQDKQIEHFTDMIASANAAGVSVADFTKELTSSKDFMAEFGETGQKMFRNSAAWAKKLGVSIKSLQNVMKLTDTFESAATAAAKLNTVFGTSINSLDLMLEDDPAKRFNIIRDAMIGVGKNMKNLDRRELKLFADTMGMTIEETQAFLDSGKDYNKFMAEKAKADKEAARNTANMNKLMGRAADTLLNWSALGQKVIREFMPIVNDFLKGLGFDSIGEAAQGLSKEILKMVKIIVPALKEINFQQIGADLREILKNFFTKENLSKFTTGLVDVFKTFYGIVNGIAQFAASPGGKFIASMMEFIGKYGDMIAAMWAGAKGLTLVAGSTVSAPVMGALAAGGAIGYGGGMLLDKMGIQDIGKNRSMEDLVAANRALGMDQETAVAVAVEEWNKNHPTAANVGQSEAGRQPVTVGDSALPAFSMGGPGTGVLQLPPQAPGQNQPQIIQLLLDGRLIQQIPFNTWSPVNVSVPGGR